jgi:hypothetical protein
MFFEKKQQKIKFVSKDTIIRLCTGYEKSAINFLESNFLVSSNKTEERYFKKFPRRTIECERYCVLWYNRGVNVHTMTVCGNVKDIVF